MQRSPSLRPLSHDHYQGLVLAFSLQKALRDGAAVDALSRQAVDFWHAHLVQHFADEEVLLAILHVLEADVLANRLLAEHTHLQMLVKRLAETPEEVEGLKTFIEVLRAHIRFEERVIFPYIERYVKADVLNLIGARLHKA